MRPVGFSMDSRHIAAVREVKARVGAMVAERAHLAGQARAVADPSSYWSEACSYFDYLLGLPDLAFGKLRLHTYHLSGDHYQTYLYEVGRRDFLARWRELVRDLPADVVLSEPAGGVGFVTEEGPIVSADIVRYQRVVNALHRNGVLSELRSRRPGRALVLEIGAGYGALLQHVTRLAGAAVGVIVDLPETLLFSGAYLSLVHAPERVYLYEPRSYQSVLESGFADYDFLLFPNYRLDALRAMQFDLVINLASLQEMRVAQVASYLDFIHETCRGAFYSCNQDSQPRNAEPLNVSRLLRERFEVRELSPVVPPRRVSERLHGALKSILKRMAVAGGFLPPPDTDLLDAVPYREYLCRAQPHRRPV